MNKLIYFHGFGSSGEGGTVKTLKELLPDWTVMAPDIPVDPAEAMHNKIENDPLVNGILLLDKFQFTN